MSAESTPAQNHIIKCRAGQRNPLASRGKVVAVPALDYTLIAIVATLLAVGLVEVYSASFMLYGSYFFTMQLLWIALGIVVLLAMALIPHRFWQQAAVPMMAVTLFLLVLVLLFGRDAYGARRTLFSGRLQPSEFTKLAVIIYVAAWVASKKKRLKDVRAGLIPFAVVMGVVSGLVVLEKSFSVTIVILVVGIAIFFLGGGDVKQLLVTGLIASVVLLLLIYKFNYGVLRIQEWWQALTDPNNAPYNVAQVHEIIRKGGGIGMRPDNWLQKDLVPLLWSDYLFANIAADFKFIGAMTVVVLFAALGYRGLNIAINAPDEFSGLVGIGVTTWMLTQAIVHIGTSVAMIPATGIPLPFMSYGGSAMIASLAGVGLLLSISRASAAKRAPYESFSLGWWNRRARLSDSSSDERFAAVRASSGPRMRRRTSFLTRIKRAVGPTKEHRNQTTARATSRPKRLSLPDGPQTPARVPFADETCRSAQSVRSSEPRAHRVAWRGRWAAQELGGFGAAERGAASLEVSYVGEKGGIEESLVRRAGASFVSISTGQIRGRSPMAVLRNVLRMAAACGNVRH